VSDCMVKHSSIAFMHNAGKSLCDAMEGKSFPHAVLALMQVYHTVLNETQAKASSLGQSFSQEPMTLEWHDKSLQHMSGMPQSCWTAGVNMQMTGLLSSACYRLMPPSQGRALALAGM